jgi:peptide chain release factor 1
LDREAGGHRIQRVPPTEKNGRVQTSTVTVAVLNSAVNSRTLADSREESDFKVEWFSGTGSGGQHRNKHQNSCRLIHIPTGIEQIAQTRSRTSSLNQAKLGIIKVLDELVFRQNKAVQDTSRKSQVGSGERGDKIRTYIFKIDTVNDHISGKVASCKEVLKGKFDLLW